MSVLYLTEQGSTVNLSAGRVVIRKGDERIHDLPVFKLEQIVAYGNIHLTTPVIAHCLRAGVDVVFLGSGGKYRGRLQPEFTKNALPRLKQHARAGDPDFCLRQSAAIVAGKIRNMAAMIRGQRRLRDAAPQGGRAAAAELEAFLPRVAAARTLEQLNGHEGAATVVYFQAFRHALKGDWEFNTRDYHPPKDPINALLSLGYTLLYNDLYAAVNIVGLDPFAGCYHQPRHGHAALASDLMEEHRAPLVDRLVLSAVNLRTIAPADFTRGEENRLELKPEALKRFFVLYAEAVRAQTFYPYASIRTTYRQLIELQVRHFARVLLGEEPHYRPYEFAPLSGK